MWRFVGHLAGLGNILAAYWLVLRWQEGAPLPLAWAVPVLLFVQGAFVLAHAHLRRVA